MPVTESRLFSPTATSVAAARQFVGEVLGTIPTDVSEKVQLITSELATNCVVHAQTSFEVCVLRGKGEVRVEVSDGSADLPVPRWPGNDEPTGRGLQIVAALSQDWGVVPEGVSGTRVWFTVRWP